MKGASRIDPVAENTTQIAETLVSTFCRPCVPTHLRSVFQTDCGFGTRVDLFAMSERNNTDRIGLLTMQCTPASGSRYSCGSDREVLLL